VWRLRRASAGAAVVLAGALAACSGGAPGGAGAADRPLKVVGQFEVHSLDPATSSGFFTLMQVAETLVTTDTQGRLGPGLASSWQASADRRSWRFALRPEALFHDGTPVTGGAVAAALEVARGKEGGPLATAPITAIKADGESGVTVQLSEPFAPLPAVLAHTSAQVLAPASYGPDRAVRAVIGTGPYRVKRVQPPQSIEVAAFDRWSGPKPAEAEVTYLAVSRSESRALMAGSGEADVTFGLDPVSLQGMQRSSRTTIVSVTAPRTILLKVNAGSPFLSDVRVRRALSLALDRRAMATALLRDPELAAAQLFPPSLPQWHQPGLSPLAHDLTQARQLLAQAGWRPGADGVLVKAGRRFQISLRTFPDRPELPPLATAIQAALKAVGVALDVRVGNSSEIPAGHQDGSLELALYARNFSLVPDPLATLLEDLAPGGADWGAMNWNSPRLTSALQSLAAGQEEAAASAARLETARILQAELPLIPVAWYRQSAAVATGLEGLTLDPLERSWRLSEVSRAR
jgi:peptide/nickel transport system substrate-binding protein